MAEASPTRLLFALSWLIGLIIGLLFAGAPVPAQGPAAPALPAISCQAGAPDEQSEEMPRGRLLMVRRALEDKQPAISVAADFGASERAVRKWLARWRVGGLGPPPPAAEFTPDRPLPSPAAVERGLRAAPSRLEPFQGARSADSDPAVPARGAPGELIYIDTKKLGRIAGIGHRITGRRPW